MRRTSLYAAALLLLGAPGALSAQGSEPGARASLEGSLARTTVLDSNTTFAGVAGLMSLGGRFAFGASGNLMLGSLTVESAGAGSDLDLRMAFGGLILQTTLASSGERYLALRALVGAGNAKLTLPLVGSEIAADNFGVLEPQLMGATPVAGPLQVGLGAAYRHVFGLEDLPNVAAADLEGFTVRAQISIRTNE